MDLRRGIWYYWIVSTATGSSRRAQFERDGFYIFRDVLDEPMLDRLREASDASLGEKDEQHFADNVTTGSMILVDRAFIERHPVFAELIAYPGILEALASLGFRHPKFGHGRVISKPPHSPRLFWHQDGRFWDDPVSLTPVPIQSFLMFYLVDTSPENGCLRVVPGSHLKRHSLHDLAPPTQRRENTRYEDPHVPAFERAEGEIDVPLRAGDFVMGYGTLFHASHPNAADQRRTCLTMWYYPAFPDLPERTKATVAQVESNTRLADITSPEVSRLLAPLEIDYRGDAEPITTNTIPSLK